MGAAGAGTAAGMADLPTTRLRWLGSVRGPLFLPGPRRIPRHATPPMTRSQRPATNRDLTRQMILERPCSIPAACCGHSRLQKEMTVNGSVCFRAQSRLKPVCVRDVEVERRIRAPEGCKSYRYPEARQGREHGIACTLSQCDTAIPRQPGQFILTQLAQCRGRNLVCLSQDTRGICRIHYDMAALRIEQKIRQSPAHDVVVRQLKGRPCVTNLDRKREVSAL